MFISLTENKSHFKMLKDFLALFFPNTCIGCNRALGKGESFVCTACQLDLPKTKNHEVAIPAFSNKFSGLIPYQEVLIYLHFNKRGKVQRLLHALKYQNKPELAELLGKWYGYDLLLAGYKCRFDVIVPVPLHKNKQRIRGYNQSEHFANGLGEALDVNVNSEVLKRVKVGESQTKKSRAERWENVSKTYDLKGKSDVEGQHVLLVDDVLTTGSTLVACAELLSGAGCASISFGVIAAGK